MLLFENELVRVFGITLSANEIGSRPRRAREQLAEQMLLAEAFSCQPDSSQPLSCQHLPTIAHRPDGSPYLRAHSSSSKTFNEKRGVDTQHVDVVKPKMPPISISHCAYYVIMALAKTSITDNDALSGNSTLSGNDALSIGIDVESTDRGNQLQRVADKFLATDQRDWCADNLTLLRAWTIKEAIYKALLTPGLPLTDIPLPDQPLGQAPHASQITPITASQITPTPPTSSIHHQSPIVIIDIPLPTDVPAIATIALTKISQSTN